MEAYTGLLSEAECIQVIDILQAAYNQYNIYFIWDKNLQVYKY